MAAAVEGPILAVKIPLAQKAGPRQGLPLADPSFCPFIAKPTGHGSLHPLPSGSGEMPMATKI